MDLGFGLGGEPGTLGFLSARGSQAHSSFLEGQPLKLFSLLWARR